MDKPKYLPEQWVVAEQQEIFGKVVGGYVVDSGWIYVIDNGQENKAHIEEAAIKMILENNRWITPPEPSSRIRT